MPFHYWVVCPEALLEHSQQMPRQARCNNVGKASPQIHSQLLMYAAQSWNLCISLSRALLIVPCQNKSGGA